MTNSLYVLLIIISLHGGQPAVVKMSSVETCEAAAKKINNDWISPMAYCVNQ